jgi:Skp family chaperone for outer membrane proteins
MLITSDVLAQSKSKSKDSKSDIINIPVPFAILDVQKILRDAKAVQSIREQIAAIGLTFETEIEKEREKLRKANQELARQRTILAPEVFAEKRREFEQRVVDVQRIVQKRQRDLDKSRSNALSKVNQTYVSIVKKLAKERELLMIIRKVQTAYANPDLDLTNEVLVLLDKKKPTVNVVKPE